MSAVRRYFAEMRAAASVRSLLRTKSMADVHQETGDSSGGAAKAGGLKRVLGVVDLIAYGVGSTVGAGVYTVIAVAGAISGPSVVVAFLVCCLACVCTGLVYAEFAVRIPQAGSAYTFGYTTFGELLAWTVGWALTLEYAISAAAVARSFGTYIESLVLSLGGQPPNWVSGFDLGSGFVVSPISAALVLLMSGIMLLGVKNSSLFNVIMTVVNLCVLAFFVIAGAVLVKPANWVLPPTNETLDPVFTNTLDVLMNLTCPQNNGTLLNPLHPLLHPLPMTIPNPGGFFPFSAGGVLKAAGILFFSYLGFDSVSTLAEEARNPGRDLPIGIIGSLLIAGGVYAAISMVLNGMVPWNYFVTLCYADPSAAYQINQAPLAFAFSMHGWNWAAIIMAVGALLATAVATFTSLLGQPRVFFRMSRDGLFFPVFGRLNPKTGIPTLGSVVVGLMVAGVALLVPIDALAEFISLGSLYAFTTVDMGLIMYRYGDGEGGRRSRRAFVLLLSFLAVAIVSTTLINVEGTLDITSPLTIVAIVGFAVLLAIGTVFATLPQRDDLNQLVFRTPLVPLVPLVGIFVNTLMMTARDLTTYIAFLVWFVIGLLIYFLYGMQHSELNKRDRRLLESPAEHDLLVNGNAHNDDLK